MEREHEVGKQYQDTVGFGMSLVRRTSLRE
jgi:hypothetical protein